ncbi:MAG: glycosyltransferase, partial [Muribaculaceae bacterium]|nr:glycosyltransferase [Muribaculaceae bacterium]
LVIVENRPYEEFTRLLRNAHVVLDQIYSYTPATTALLAMAYGLNVVSGGEPEYYDFIGERDKRPIINAPIDVEPLTDVIEDIILHPELIRERGRRSREFVEKHNDCRVVAHRFLDFWLKRIK